MTEARRLEPLPTPPRHPVLTPWRIERSARCINCGTCIRACLYGCHERSAADPRKMADPKPSCCRNCFACVLYCPRQALTMHPCAEYAAQGDAVYTPAVIRATLEQAAAGKIPVSGAGYGGPFDGTGYDGIWTDMSEIVRPTRDGIHGREHISTVVHLGRFVPDLCGMQFDDDGALRSPLPPNREIGVPVLFDALPFSPGGAVTEALALAARRLSTFATLRLEDHPEALPQHFNHLTVRLRPDDVVRRRDVLEWATIVELEAPYDPARAIAQAREINPHILTVLRLPVSAAAERLVREWVDAGAETIHLAADRHGRGADGTTLLDCLRRTHLLLVEHGVREQVTLVASGGLAAAEHVPKTILLGADAVAVDVPLLVAMECTVCGACERGEPCPRELAAVEPRWGASRVVNLMLAWRDQLLEVLGAMGIRDVRRLRGETGRAIFAEQAREDFRKRLGQVPDRIGGADSGSCSEGEAVVASRTPNAGPPAPPPNAEGRTPNASLSPHRFPTRLGSFHVVVDRARCVDCGLCADSCRFGVHRRIDGRLALDEPLHGLCIGLDCRSNDWCCINVCPWEALRVEPSGVDGVLGDRRWTASLLRSGWNGSCGAGEPLDGVDACMPSDPPLRVAQAPGAERQCGASGGGFDRLRLAARGPAPLPADARVDLSLSLNRRGTGPEVTIALPVYGGGMSYGSVSLEVMRGRAMAATAIGTFTSTGEGGYPEELAPYADHVITQVATGLFGVREETIRRARLVEFKYAQGAKPGLGGHLLGSKNTPRVAAMREAVPGTSLFSPFPFHSVYSVEDHKKHLDWIRSIHPDVLVSVKVSTPADVDMVAVGSYYAGANIVHLDGSYGGTGAAPDIAKKNIAQPIEYAVAQVHDFLVAEGIRDRVVLMASGGVRTAEDALKAIALGADGVVIGTAELVAIDCVRCGNCERDRGCPIGIATTDPDLEVQLESGWVRDRIAGLYRSWAEHFARRLRALGLPGIRALRGRRDLLAEDGEVRP